MNAEKWKRSVPKTLSIFKRSDTFEFRAMFSNWSLTLAMSFLDGPESDDWAGMEKEKVLVSMFQVDLNVNYWIKWIFQ